MVAVLAESFERIHRSNLIGMGVLPLQFAAGTKKDDLKLQGTEVFDILGIKQLAPRGQVSVQMTREDGRIQKIRVDCRLDTRDEFDYYRHGGDPPLCPSQPIGGLMEDVLLSQSVAILVDGNNIERSLHSVTKNEGTMINFLIPWFLAS